MQDIPVVLLNYNRPEFSKRLVENLAKIKPKKVYISIDGHKSNVVGDKNKVDQVETAFANIQWDCEVKLRRNEIELTWFLVPLQKRGFLIIFNLKEC